MRFKNDLNGSYLAGGISMYSDVAGASKMRSTAVNFTFAAHVKIDNKNYLSGGFKEELSKEVWIIQPAFARQGY